MARKSKKTELAIVPVTGDTPTDLISMGIFTGELGNYELFGVNDGDGNPTPLVETPVFKLAVVRHPSGQLGLAKVNATEEAKEALDAEARILRTLQQIARKIDAEADAKAEIPPYHGAFIPVVSEVIDADKYVLLLGYHPSISTYKQLVPLSVVTHADRIDLKSATWMLGKVLKTLSFVHALGFTMGNLDASTIFIEREVHGVILFDFSAASEDANTAEMQAEVAQAAKIIWEAVGGNSENRPPFDTELMSEEQYAEYLEVLSRIMRGETDGAEAEHKLIYAPDTGLADRIWPRTEVAPSILKRDFHDFVTYPR